MYLVKSHSKQEYIPLQHCKECGKLFIINRETNESERHVSLVFNGKPQKWVQYGYCFYCHPEELEKWPKEERYWYGKNAEERARKFINNELEKEIRADEREKLY